jgi:putative phosphoesterase
MKIFVFADSHMDTEPMLIAVEKGRPDRIIHLGDLTQDAEDLYAVFPEIGIDIVRGNNDYQSRYPSDKLLVLEGKRLFMSHGDRYGVKISLKRIIRKGHDESCDVLLFGHTHMPYIKKHGGMWVMNPGSAGRGFFGTSKSASYGVVEIAGGEFHCEIRKI